MIRLTDLALPFDHSNQDLVDIIVRRLCIDSDGLIGFDIVRRSIDARHANHILAVYTIDARLKDEPGLLAAFSDDPRVGVAPCTDYDLPAVTERCNRPSPVIAGSGPCGLFAALILAQAGCKPILIERGKQIASRVEDVHNFWRRGILDPESNVLFGEGGAGTFSDGKLTTRIKDKHNRCRKVLRELVEAGAPADILTDAKPHIGTDNLVGVIKNIRTSIISLGGQVRFETKLTDIRTKDGVVTAAIVNDTETIPTDIIVLAPGHSARDTFTMLHDRGVPMTAKAFSIGVRIEHPQSLINAARYGRFAEHPRLGPADYQLTCHCPNNRSAYTFCMCPGGAVIASSSEPGTVVTNGMSRYLRNQPNANSGLLVGVGPGDFGSDHPLAGVEFQRRWEQRAFALGGANYHAPIQLAGDFCSGRPSGSLGNVRPSYTPGTTLCDLAECLPDFVVETLRLAIPQMDAKLNGFALHDAVMTALESRSSSPVRILRDDTFQSPAVRGLYPAGEGAGYAGGIISAAVDGIRIAEAICRTM